MCDIRRGGAWFGEWRAHDAKNPSETVDIPQGVNINNKNRFVKNSDTQWKIQITEDLIGDSLHYADKDKLYIERLLTHIVLTISPRPFWSQGGSRDGYAELIAKAVDEKRILSYDKEKGSVLSVIAQQARLGNITEASLNDSISRLKRFVNDFKQKIKSITTLPTRSRRQSGTRIPTLLWLQRLQACMRPILSLQAWYIIFIIIPPHSP